jgi:hypothetical protein
VKSSRVFSIVFEMILKKCFLINLLVIFAVYTVSVGAADVCLNGTCSSASQLDFSGQVVGSSDTVKNITFSGSCNKTTVDTIWFRSSPIYFLPAALFTIFPNLKELYIRESDLRELRNNTFQNAKKLVRLEFQYTNMFSLEANAFAGASSLQLLSIINFNDFPINANAFKGLKELASIWVAGTYTTSIKKELFADNTKLKNVGFGWCRIKGIEPLALSGLTELEGFMFGTSGLVSVEKNLFQKNSKLLEIYLEGSNLKTVLHGDFFKNQSNVEKDIFTCGSD